MGSRNILFAREWAPVAQPLSFENNVTFVIQEEDSPDNHIVTRGRLELDRNTGGAGAAALLRLRAASGSDRVEGGQRDGV